MEIKKPKSRSGTKWTAADRAANGDALVQVRFSGRAKLGDTVSDADMLKSVTRSTERPAEALRRLVRQEYGRTTTALAK